MAIVFCGQILASTESATSGQSATSRCLSVLPGCEGRLKFVLNGLGWKKINQHTYTPIRPLPGDSAPLGVVNTAVTRGGAGIRSRGEGGRAARPRSPFKKKFQKPRGKYTSAREVNDTSLSVVDHIITKLGFLARHGVDLICDVDSRVLIEN